MIEEELKQASILIEASRKTVQTEPPRRLYHYTNTSGLIGILDSARIWATHYRYLNDSSEGDYGFALFERIIMSKKEKADNDVCAEFLNRTINTANAFDGMADFYVACFCEEDDLLNQWRSYTDSGGGFSIGFESREFGMRIRIENPSQEFYLRKVIYDVALQTRLIEEVLDSALIALTRSSGELSVGEANKAIAKCCQFVRGAVAEYLISFKHPAFETEKEWRLCHVAFAHEDRSLKFRNGPYGLTPYICLDPSPMAGVNSNRLPIGSIRHGPTNNAKSIQFSLNKLLRQHSYPFVEISGTELPMRVNL